MSGTRIYTDQMGRVVEVPASPQRIVSVVPSQSELLFDLGLAERIAGLTWFCIHPEPLVHKKIKVGGTKNLKLDNIREINPDLIIGNKEENEQTQIEALEKEFPVWLSDIYTLEDACNMIRSLGEISGTVTEASELARQIQQKFASIEKAPPRRTLYLIWREPYMSVGSKTFIHHMLTEVCGLKNVCAEDRRYPELSKEDIMRLSPELILLSSEPYPFKDKHIEELRAMVPDARIMLADGEMFSWYGSRLLKAADYLKAFLHSL